MSEENTPQEMSQPEVTETPTSPSMDLDSTIKVDGQEVSVRELLNSRDEATKLKEYNEILKYDGLSDDQIKDYEFYLDKALGLDIITPESYGRKYENMYK